MKLERVKSRLASTSLFWKAYAFIVTLLIVVVGLAEFILEPLAESMLQGIYDDAQPWHEAAIWAVSILIPSLVCGYVLSKTLSLRLGKIVKASKALAKGNLEIRLPVLGNEKDDFDILAQSFNEMSEAIKTQRLHGRRLLADISHELRSPLTRITVATDLLSRNHASEEIAAISSRLEKEVSQMDDMVSLLLSQAWDKQLAPNNNTPLDFSGILRGLADDFSFQGEMHGIRVQAAIPGQLAVYGNAIQLERMLGNILSNAIFYSPSETLITMEAYCKGGNILIKIRDQGPGVPEDQLQEIFRAFYRVDDSRTRTSGGVGLGLAMAMEAAILHGGHISACNARPGLEVTVSLPAYFADDEEDAGTHE